MINKPVVQEKIIKRLNNVLKGQAMFIRDDDTISDEEKLEQIKVVEQLVNFLRDYDENLQVLEYYRSHKVKSERQMQDIEKEDMGYDRD